MAQPLAHNITTRRTARYFTLGNTVNPAKVWVVLHGYGYLGSVFINHFADFVKDDTLIIAPEGLSRFYAKGLGGDVVASWMTREDRLADITDNVTYLDTIYSEVIQPLGNVELNALGFSQGVATLCRWATMGLPKFNQLVLCSGDIPNDLVADQFAVLSQISNIHVIYGTEDTLIPPGYTEKLMEMLDAWDVRYQSKTFAGKHELNNEILAEFI
jgi:predicted esterase